ncbi:non-ribosomal peptide synthetase [Sphingomonas sp.]|uniref:non-ribosomal peptide synthetase n=1 Tax=Sphingomonas sp. TaxID=28214 RepID=UPI0025E6DDE7|nr:non-ribosomal peptide synthetase [Sphingomonas sp.]
MALEDPVLSTAQALSPAPLLLHHFLEPVVVAHADHAAIDIPPGRGRETRRIMTYRELTDRSDRLAQHLAPLISDEAIVALLLPRTSPLLYVAQIAALKAGAAFTCLDPSFPDNRMREIVEDAAPIAVLTDREGMARLGALDLPVRLFDAAVLLAAEPPPVTLPADLPPERLAYVIYTSGTTGHPKGVMIEHRNIANLVASDVTEFALSASDRVIQGSSAAYDSSLEETWLAFAAGATLVVMDDAAARLGPDIVRWLREERATVFCPPPTLLRSSGCTDPARDLPDLKLLYVGGEALPRDIADLWSQGRRLVNGYGPTECAVTCLRGDIAAVLPITIGKPIPNMAAWALDEELQPVADGERGELCIGGAGVARGYRHRPDLTAEKFVEHPEFGRIYRTGDLVHREVDGDFFYHGRIDAQVKLRGYRVELAEIEARLAALPGVRAAGCRVQDHRGAQELIAYIVPEDPANPPRGDTLKAQLATTLPRYMVPRDVATIAEIPTTVGGKIDRAALPEMPVSTEHETGVIVAPQNDLERLLADGMADILKRPGGVSVDADFFEDLGGDSLSAAMLVTLLRDHHHTEWITVSDIYDARTVRGLAKLAGRIPAFADASDEPPLLREGEARPLLANIVQIAWLSGQLLVGAWATWFAAFILLPPIFGDLGLPAFILLAPVLALAAAVLYIPLSVAFAVAVKRLVIGKYRPIRAPVWSPYYLRHWIVCQAARLIPWPMLQGTVFQQIALRALGAKIGRRVHLHRGVDLRRGGWDLLEIGDDVAIGQDAHIGLVELDRGDIVVGSVTLEDGATMMVRAGVEGDCRIGAGSVLTALSVLNAGGTIPAGEIWDGVPAGRTGMVAPAPALPIHSRQMKPWRHSLLMMLAEGAAAMIAALPAELLTLAACRLSGVGFDQIWRWMYHPVFASRTAMVVIGLTVVSIPLTLVWTALMFRLIGRVHAGTIGRWSAAYIRVWIKTGMLHTAGEWLSGTLFWSKWLRLAGMNIGAKCEISTILDVVPELITIGEETFFADGIYLGGAEVRQGSVRLAPVRLGRNTFLGNHAVIPAGETLPDDILIGIGTVADSSLIEQGQSRFGHPSFDLPRREIVEADRRLTHDPSAIRYLNRLFWEVLRFALPVVPLMLTLLWYTIMVDEESAPPLVYQLVVIPLAALVPLVALCATVLALKWMLIGRVKPGHHALWSCWCSRWDFVYVAWAKYATLLLQGLEGTFLLPAYLRAMGLRIGKRAVLGPQFAQVVDPDMIRIGDGATVTAMFQAHTFEDRVLKVDRVTIAAGATVAAATVPLYGAVIGENTYVGAHSVVMKHEHLLPGLRYQGVPTRVMGHELPVAA